MTARATALDSLRALDADELAAHLREQRGQLFQVRLQQTIGQVENHRQIRAIRKEIARAMTVQVEAKIAAERGEEPPAPRAPATPSRRARAAAEEKPAAPPRRRRLRGATATAAVPETEAIVDIEVERVEADDAEVEPSAATGESEHEEAP